MSMTTIIFDGLYATMPEARWQIKVNRESIAQAMSSGVSRVPVLTDQGKGRAVTGELKFKTADGIAGTQFGDIIEAKPQAEATWQSFRVGGRGIVGGITTIQLENPDE